MNDAAPGRIIRSVMLYVSYVLGIAISVAACAETTTLSERDQVLAEAKARWDEQERQGQQRRRELDAIEARRSQEMATPATPSAATSKSYRVAEVDPSVAAPTTDRGRETELEAEARKRCRWQNDPIYEVRRAEGTRLPVYREQYVGNWRSKPICEKGTPPEVLQAAGRIAARLEQPTP